MLALVCGVVLGGHTNVFAQTASPVASPRADQAIRERIVSLHGLPTRVIEVGDLSAAHTAILINGGPGQSSDHLGELFALAAPDLRVVTYDQRGTGGTPRPPDGDYTLPALIADLDALVTTLGGEPVHLIGNSWGGFLAAAYTGSHPDRVASLSLIGPMPLSPFPDAYRVWPSGDAGVEARIRVLQEDGIIPERLPHWLSDEDCAYWNALLPAYMSDPTNEDRMTVLGSGTCSLYVHQRTYSGAMNFVSDTRYREGIVPAAVDWTGPVYIIFGARDPFREAYSAPAVAAFPSARLTVETVPAAGHYPWAEDPALIDRLRAFIFAAAGRTSRQP